MTLDDKQVQISEKVRFWEEQDEINKILIPRVIRQHELLAKHIKEHENLPIVVSQAVKQAVDEAREEQRQLYESALESLRAEFMERSKEQKREYESSLEATRSEFDEHSKVQQRQYDDSLSAAHTEFSATLEGQAIRLRNINLVAAVCAVATALLVSVLAVLLIG